MFSKGDDHLKSSIGSPAFASPELTRVGVGNISGKAADIWAMGITLYALVYGILPFHNHNVLELYEEIRNQGYIVSSIALTAESQYQKTKIPTW
jgi:calcium/calmodulin-dependent protein kinase kinase 2